MDKQYKPLPQGSSTLELIQGMLDTFHANTKNTELDTCTEVYIQYVHVQCTFLLAASHTILLNVLRSNPHNIPADVA